MTAFIILVCLLIILFIITVFMYLYKKKSSFSSDFNAAGSDIIKNPQSINSIAASAVDQKTYLNLRINNRGPQYTSTFIHVNTSVTPTTLIIDGLVPKEGNSLIRKAESVLVEFSLREQQQKNEYFIPYRFATSYAGTFTYEGYPAIELSLPVKVSRDQRRSYLRVEPSMLHPIRIQFDSKGTQCTGKVVNISAGGVSFMTNLDPTQLRPGLHINTVRLNLPDGTTVESSAIVRSSTSGTTDDDQEEGMRQCCCSLEFINLMDAYREKIVKYAIEQERKYIKRRKRQSPKQ